MPGVRLVLTGCHKLGRHLCIQKLVFMFVRPKCCLVTVMDTVCCLFSIKFPSSSLIRSPFLIYACPCLALPATGMHVAMLIYFFASHWFRNGLEMHLEPLKLEKRDFLHYSGWSSKLIFSLPLHLFLLKPFILLS